MSLFKWLVAQKASVIILIFGTCVTFVSIFEIKDLKQLQFSPIVPPVFIGIIFGVFLVITSIIMIVIDDGLGPIVFLNKTRKFGGGYKANFGQAQIHILFGLLQKVEKTPQIAESRHLVILPSNEYFDDDCVRDTKTVLGAFVHENFAEYQEVLREKIQSNRSKLISLGMRQKEAGKREASYGTGQGVLIEDLPGSINPLLLVSVTTKRENEGLKSDISVIYKCLEVATNKANDKRVSRIICPLLGSGEGGIPHQLSLAIMLFSFSSLIKENFYREKNCITIVIFQKDNLSSPQVSRKAARRLLNLAAYLHN